VGYLLAADPYAYVCRTWNDLAARLVWAREEGYATAKARRANGDVRGRECIDRNHALEAAGLRE
jgi:hypothetical protein